MKRFRLLTSVLCAVVLLCGFSATAYAGGGEDYGDQTMIAPTEEPSPEPEPNPFTPSGTGTVVDNATEQDGKEFFTITTPAENVFYLVIDRQRGTENVYFLNAVAEADLLALAELTEEPPAPTPEPEPPADPEPVTEPEPEPKTTGGAGPLLLGLAVLLIGGGAAFYFKVYRPKHQKAAEPEEDYGAEYDGEEDYGAEDDGPPWDEDDNQGEEDEV